MQHGITQPLQMTAETNIACELAYFYMTHDVGESELTTGFTLLQIENEFYFKNNANTRVRVQSPQNNKFFLRRKADSLNVCALCIMLRVHMNCRSLRNKSNQAQNVQLFLGLIIQNGYH